MILLDTHTLIWLVSEPKKLSRSATTAIKRAYGTAGNPGGGVSIAAITLWELPMLFARGRLRSRGTVEAAVRSIVETARVHVHELDVRVGTLAAQLPGSVPEDPADRMIIATAMVHALPLVTRDGRIHDSGVCKTVW